MQISAQLSYKIMCVFVCVCAQAHTGERFLEKQEQSRFSFYDNLNDKNCAIKSGTYVVVVSYELSQ